MISVENIGTLQRDLSGLTKKLTRNHLTAAIKPGAKIFRKAVLSRAPVKTGAMKKAIRIRALKGDAEAPRSTLQVYFAKIMSQKSKKKIKPYYALFVHNGTELRYRKRNSPTGQIKPNPFVADAFEAEVQRASDMILDNIEKML